MLADAGLYGPAMAHLVYSLEEAEKARSIGQIWLNSWEPRRPDRPTDDELKARVFEHAPRHKAAASKSGGVCLPSESLRELENQI